MNRRSYTGFLTLLIFTTLSHASSTMAPVDLSAVKRTAITQESERQQLQKAAVLLANYEIEATRLLNRLTEGANADTVGMHARRLLDLSETVIDSARFRLPQCDFYLAKSMGIKPHLQEISHDELEQGYHMDGALPKAPAECYHAKDLFVHPASVVVLVRDDPAMNDKTKSSIHAEIAEVLAHTEYVRQLVFYE